MNLRDLSRGDWGKRGDVPAESELTLGCLQRIADALERIAQDDRVEKLKREIDGVAAGREYWRSRAKTEERRVAALRGHLRRAKGGKS